jgi:hypothetical protein
MSMIGGCTLGPKSDQDWQAEDDCRTLLRAAEIYRDKARLKRAAAVLKREKANLDTVDAKGQAILGAEYPA